MLKKIIGEKFIHLFFAVLVAVFVGLTILTFDFKSIVILGLAAFAIFALVKMEYTFYFILAGRSVLDIFYQAETAGDVRITQFVAVIITVLFLFYFLTTRYNPLQTSVNKIYLAFLAFAILSVFLSKSPFSGFIDWLKLLQGFLFLNMTILLILKDGEDLYIKKIKAVCWSAIISLFIPYILFLKNVIQGVHIEMGGYERYFTFGSYANLFSYYLLAVFPFCIFLRSITSEKPKKMAWVIFMVLIILTIYKTYTRNVWLGIAVLLFVWNLIRKRTKLTLALIVFLILVMAFNPTVQDRLKDAYILLNSNSFYNMDPGLLSSRIGIWQSNVRYFMKESSLLNKLLGNGFDVQTETTINDMAFAMPEHNNYLTILMATGIIGLVLYCSYILKLLWEGLKLLRRTNAVYPKHIAQVFVPLVCAYLVVSFFTHMIWKLNFQYFFSVLAGIVVGINILDERKRNLKGS